MSIIINYTIYNILPIIIILNDRITYSNGILDCSNIFEKSNFSGRYAHSNLHRCFNDNRYDVTQLPLIRGAAFNEFQIEYWFDYYNLIELNNRGTLTLISDVGFKWYDSYRKWDFTKIPIEKFCVPHQEVWSPKILIANCESEKCKFGGNNQTLVCFKYNGKAYFNMEKIQISSSCNLQLEYFPFDIQICEIIIFVLIYHTPKVKLKPMTESYFYEWFESDEWELKELYDAPLSLKLNKFERNETNSQYWNLRPVNYTTQESPVFSAQLTFHRRPIYYVRNLIIPVITISLVGLFAIFLPATSSEKLNLEVTVLLGFLYLQSLIPTMIPQAINQPKISNYTFGSLIIAVANLVASSVILKLANKKFKHIPKFIDLIFVRLLGSIIFPWKVLHLICNMKIYSQCLSERREQTETVSLKAYLSNSVSQIYSVQNLTKERSTSFLGDSNKRVNSVLSLNNGTVDDVQIKQNLSQEPGELLVRNLNIVFSLLSLAFTLLNIYLFLYPLYEGPQTEHSHKTQFFEI